MGLLQVNKFGTSDASRGCQQWELVVSEGLLEALAASREFSGRGADAPQGVLGMGMHTGNVLCQERRFQTPVLMSLPLSLSLPSLPLRRRYRSDSNQPLPGEPASATDPEPDESQPRDGQQPLLQHRAPHEHGANTSVFHGPRARGHGAAAGHGHHQDGPGAEHCRINAPSSAQYRNAASSLPGCKYN